VPACRFSKEFFANLINVSTNRIRGIALCFLQKSFAIAKGFTVNWLRTYYFNKILK
jgi:hypothetical protein